MQEAHIHKRSLPHIYIEESVYFITTRLKDSIPAAIITELANMREQYKKSLLENGDDKKSRSMFQYYDKLLDKGQFGVNYLARHDVASIVYDAIMYYHKNYYIIYCFCIMPNHIHLVFEHIDKSKSINEIMKVIKGYSARKVNQLLDRKGSFWQSESFDRIIRDNDELNKTMNYVLMNPVKAKLVENQKDWQFIYINNELFDLD